MLIGDPYDAVIVGANYYSLLAACSLKAFNQKLNICVIDKHLKSEPVYPYPIKKEAIEKIEALLLSALKRYDFQINVSSIFTLLKRCKQLKKGSLPLSDLEDILHKDGNRMGISVLKYREYHPYLSEFKFESLLDPAASLTGGHEEKELRTLFKNAKLIVAADGPISSIRRECMGRKVYSADIDAEVIKDRLFCYPYPEYFASIKYEEEGKIKYFSYEIDQEAHFHFGKYGPFETLKKLETFSVSSPKFYGPVFTFKRECPGGKFISFLSKKNSFYESLEGVRKVHQKWIVLIGSALSQIPEHEMNTKNFLDVALFVQDALAFFKKNPHSPFQTFKAETHKDFTNKIWWIEFYKANICEKLSLLTHSD